MFADSVMESSSTTGTGSYTLVGAVGYSRTFAQDFLNGDTVAYFVSNLAKTKWELCTGTLTIGPPRTLTRTVKKSSNAGSAIDWQASDVYYVFSIASADALAGLVSGNLASTTRPWWVRRGGSWVDYALGLATTWVNKLYNGSVDIEEGRHELVPGIYVASPRHYWVDKGAANYTLTAADIGRVILFDVTAAARVPTLPSGAGAGVGHGFRVGLLGYGSAINGLTLTPNGTDKIDQGIASATLTLPAQRIVWVEWDGAKNQWRTDYTIANSTPGLKNLLINGEFEIDQRNSGASQTFTAGAAVAYAVDRWYVACTGANITGQQVAGTSPNSKGYKFTGAASNATILFGQRIEAYRCAHIVSQQVAVQLQAKSSSITSLTWTAYYATATDNFTSKTQIASGTLTIGAALASYQFTFNAGANAANGIAVEFSCGALLASQTLQFEAIQAELGATPSDFERIPLPLRLDFCCRYYEVGIGTIATAYIPSPGWNMANSVQFKQLKRATPTCTASAVWVHSAYVAGCVFYYTMNSAPEQDNFTWTASAEL